MAEGAGRRYVLPVLAAAGAAGAVWLLDWWVQDKALLLEYLKALAWPAVVLAAAFWLRVPLRSKLLGLEELEGAGVRAKFVRDADDDLERDLQGPVELLLASDEARAGMADCTDEFVDEADDELGDDDVEYGGELTHSAGGMTTMTPPTLATASAIEEPNQRAADEARRRDALEHVIRESAAWGYDMAQLGFSGRPEPMIEWDADGRPRILAGRVGEPVVESNVARVLRHMGTTSMTKTRAKRIEDEIQRLERQRNQPRHLIDGSAQEIDAQIERFRRQLREIDPSSPWAYG